jgi:acetylornithine/N-succinyldiaminopimelate aminotransferase
VNHLSSEAVSQFFDQYVLSGRSDSQINLVRGEGCRVWDSEGIEYLDLCPGSGSNLLGHCPPVLVQAVRRQTERLIHCSNHYLSELKAVWARMLIERSFDGRVFFCGSGAEANEAAIRLVRRCQAPERYKIVAFHGASHGKTLGALAASGQPGLHAGLGPMASGFTYVTVGDLEQLQQRIDNSTAAVLIEPIQLKSGVHIASGDFLSGLRQLCDSRGLMLIFDEVQSGCGRTGNWFAYQHFQVEPDIMTLSKGLGGGFAAGAMLARRGFTENLPVELFESSFGGNPIACAAGIATLETIESEGLLLAAVQAAELFSSHLANLREHCAHIRQVRQLGLMIGIELSIEVGPVVQDCAKHGLLIHSSPENVLCLLPPLNIAAEEIEQAMEILSSSIHRVAERMAIGDASPTAL